MIFDEEFVFIELLEVLACVDVCASVVLVTFELELIWHLLVTLCEELDAWLCELLLFWFDKV